MGVPHKVKGPGGHPPGRRVRCLLLAFLCVLSAVVPTMLLASTAKADDVTDFSFYERVSAVVGEVNEILAPVKEREDDAESKIRDGRTGNVGAYLGYSDENKNEKGIVGWFISTLSNSSSTVSYAQLEDIPVSGGGSTNSLLCYAGYGWLLSELGVDSTSNDGNVFDTLTRVAFGGILFLGYCMSCLVPWVFRGAVKIMQALNPFRLFARAVDIGANAYDGLFADLCTYISRMYDAIQDFSLVVLVPFFLVAMFVGLLLFNNPPGERGKKVLRYFMRIFFIVAGIPLIGATYTGILDAIADNEGKYGINSEGDQIILSTLVDFEYWARNTRLSPPDGVLSVKWDGDNFSIGKDCLTGPQLALEINGEAFGKNFLDSSPQKTNRLAHVDATQKADADLDMIDADILGMIGRYMSSAKYSSSSFENEQKKSIRENIDGGSLDEDDVVDWFDPKETNLKDETLKLKDKESTIFSNGAIKKGDGSGSITGKGFTFGKDGSGNGRDVTAVTGLSTMSMYNYLNTSFGDSEMTMYSSKKASSDYVRDSHMSVNHVGGEGVAGFLMIVQAIIELFVITYIGISYGFSVMFSNIKRGYRIIFDAPLAMMGSFQAIGKILAYVCVLVVELVGTLIMYDVVTQLVIALADLISAIFVIEGIKGVALFSALTGPMAIIVPCLLTISVLAYFCRIAKHLRRSFIRGVDDMCASVISKFVVNMEKTGAMMPPNMNMENDMSDGIKGVMAAGGQPHAPIGPMVAKKLNDLGRAMQLRDMLSGMAAAQEEVMGADGTTTYGGSNDLGYERDNMARALAIEDKGGITGNGNPPAMDGSSMRDSMGRSTADGGDGLGSGGMSVDPVQSGAEAVRDGMGGNPVSTSPGHMEARDAAYQAGLALGGSAGGTLAAVGVEAAEKLADNVRDRDGLAGGDPVSTVAAAADVGTAEMDAALASGGLSTGGVPQDPPADMSGIMAAMSSSPDGTREGPGAGDVVSDRSVEAQNGLTGDTSLPPAYAGGDNVIAPAGAPSIREVAADGVQAAAAFTPGPAGEAVKAGVKTAEAVDKAKDTVSSVSGEAGMGGKAGESGKAGAGGDPAGGGRKEVQGFDSGQKGMDAKSGQSPGTNAQPKGSDTKPGAKPGEPGSGVKAVSGSTGKTPGAMEPSKKVAGTQEKVKGAATGMSGGIVRGTQSGKGGSGGTKGITGQKKLSPAEQAKAKAMAVSDPQAQARGTIQGGSSSQYGGKKIEHSVPFGQAGTQAGGRRGGDTKMPTAGSSGTRGGQTSRSGGKTPQGYQSGGRGASMKQPDRGSRQQRPGQRQGRQPAGAGIVDARTGRQMYEDDRYNRWTQNNRKAGSITTAKGVAMTMAGLYSGNSYLTMKGTKHVADGVAMRTMNGGTSIQEQQVAGAMAKSVGRMVGSERLQAQGSAIYNHAKFQQRDPAFTSSVDEQGAWNAYRSQYQPGGDNVLGRRNAGGREDAGGYGGRRR